MTQWRAFKNDEGRQNCLDTYASLYLMLLENNVLSWNVGCLQILSVFFEFPLDRTMSTSSFSERGDLKLRLPNTTHLDSWTLECIHNFEADVYYMYRRDLYPFLAAFAVRISSRFFLQNLHELGLLTDIHNCLHVYLLKSLALANPEILEYFFALDVVNLRHSNISWLYHDTPEEVRWDLMHYMIYQASNNIELFVMCMKKLVRIDIRDLTLSLLDCPYCEGVIRSMWELCMRGTNRTVRTQFNGDILPILFEMRMVHALRDLKKLTGWRRTDAIEAGAVYSFTVQGLLVFNGVHVREMVHLLMNDFGLTRNDIMNGLLESTAQQTLYNHVVAALDP